MSASGGAASAGAGRPKAAARYRDPLDYTHPWDSMRRFAQLLALRFDMVRTRHSYSAPARRFGSKPDGSQRPLGVPTVLDRVIQQAIAQVLTPLYDGGFSQHIYGLPAILSGKSGRLSRFGRLRSGRNAHPAIRHVESGWKQKRRHAVDCDLKALLTLHALRVLPRRICLPAVGSTP